MSIVTCAVEARKYERDPKNTILNIFLISGKFLRISLDVIVFIALIYFWSIEYGCGRKNHMKVVFICFNV